MSLDIIWNLTRECNWDCSDCCINAIKINPSRSIKSYLQSSGTELYKSDKLKILRDLSDKDCRIDFSGGNPILCSEDREIIIEASKIFSKDKVDVSIPGCNLTQDMIKTLKSVGKIHITIDEVPYAFENNSRPLGFNKLAIKTVRDCMGFGKDVRVVTVLRKNTKLSSLSKIYKFLCEINVREWQLLRLYPVGRATGRWSDTIDQFQIQSIIEFLKTLNGITEIKLQHSFKEDFEKIRCPAARNSIGILPSGKVVACPWGLNSSGEPIDRSFILGKMPEQKIEDILSSKNALLWSKEGNKCRTFEFLRKNCIYNVSE